LMLPYELKKTGKLSPPLKAIDAEVRGIPSFILVDAATGAVLSKDGRGLVSKDASGAWIRDLVLTASKPSGAATANAGERKPSMDSTTTTDATPRVDEKKAVNVAVQKMIDGVPLLKSVDKADITELKSGDNLVTAIYFSAHWCPPCRRFTP